LGEYLTPDVYTENKSNSYKPIESVATTTTGFVGISQRGKVGNPTLVTSWSDYINKFAGGLDTPFMRESDLAYAVRGFFQNKGKRAFIVRADNGGSMAASVTLDVIMTDLAYIRDSGNEEPAFLQNDTVEQAYIQGLDANTNQITITALDEGEWGNELTVTVEANEDFDNTYDVVIKFRDLVESYSALSNDLMNQRYFAKWINQRSSLVNFSGGILSPVGTVTLSGGADGNDGLIDSDYDRALEAFDPIIEDINLLVVPGQTSTPMLKKILDYCSVTGEVFPILEMPAYLNVLEERAIRKELTGVVGAIYDPWLKVNDPISLTGEYRDVPPGGHLAGIFSRVISERGVHKAPAGVEADVRGIIDLTTRRVKGETDLMNPVSINTIVPRKNYGICVWGARTLNPDTNFRYVSDELLNIMIKKSIRLGTQWCVFEPNYIDAPLWRDVKKSIEAYLETLRRNGQIAGKYSWESYWVQVDSENNTQETIDNGFLYIDFGYAPTKPAEFVVERVQHGMIREG
jgi:phage tail sheath protein FI